MDQVKIGKFIAECRKKNSLTQMQLAEMLNITDRAVSKWECGKALPDSSIMLELCEILKISVTDLLSGEVVSMDNYNEKAEQKLIEMVKQKETADKHLLLMEVVLGTLLFSCFFALAMVASFVQMDDWMRILLILIGLVPFLVAVPFLLKIEQSAGYYECAECSHKYVPEFKSVFLAMHMGRTRYMKCPKCGQKSWQKKRVGKD